MADRTLSFDIFARDRASQAFQSASRSSDGLSSSLKKMAGVAAGAFAAVGAGRLFGDMITEAREAAKVGRLTEAVIKSTAGVANVTSASLGKLADRLSNVAAVDDEVIQSAGNVLLTFTKVRNEAGKGNAIFDRAAEAALNMSAALGTDLQGATLQLGKALNDPIKGLTALGRAGVSFTQQQKDQVKAMVAAGDVLGAQKIILGEMETQFGGAAAAAADPMQRLGVVVDNLKERVGTAFLPVVERLSLWLGERLPGYLDVAGRGFSAVGKALAPLVVWFKNAVRMGGFLIDMFKSGDADAAGFAEILDNVFGNTGRLIDPLMKLYDIGQTVVAFMQDHWKPVLLALGVAFVALTAPITGVVAGLAYAYARFQWFRDGVRAVVDFMTGAWESHRTKVMATLTKLGDAFSAGFGAIRVIVETVVKILTEAWERFGSGLVDNVVNAFGHVYEALAGVIETLTGIFDLIKAILTGKWGDAWEALKDIFVGVWHTIYGVVLFAFEALRAMVETAMGAISGVWSLVWNSIKTFFSDIWDGIKNIVHDAVEYIIDEIDRALGPVDELIAKLANGKNEFVRDIESRPLGGDDESGGGSGWTRDWGRKSVNVTNNIDARGVDADEVIDAADRYSGWRLGLAGGG